MAYTENTIQNRKNKHLSSFERGEISALHQAGHSNLEIARRLGRVHQTIGNELSVERQRNLWLERRFTQHIFLRLDRLFMTRTEKTVVQKISF